ncbi:PAS domain-containing protein [Aromatoleum sp.]|uniref:PAS domain-containing protein n=1 Tax=Aromatoleum sp. TaxID=2307007 RepID=UPI002FCA162E
MLVESNDELLALLDTAGTVLRINVSQAALFGLPASALVGKPFWSEPLWHDCCNLGTESIRHAIQDAERDGKARLRGQLTGTTGQERSIELTFKRIPAPGGDAWITVTGLVDVVACDVADARVCRLSRLYAAISETNAAMLRSAGPEDVYRTVCAACVKHCGYWLAWIGICDPVSNRIVPVESAGRAAAWLEGALVTTDVSCTEGQSPCSTAYHEQRVCRVSDLRTAPDLAPWQRTLVARGLTYAIALPLRRGGAPFGTLAVYGDDDQFVDDEAVKLLEEMADNISFALDHFDREALRQQAELALRESEARLHEAQAVGRIGDWELDRDVGGMTWSPQLFHLFERPLALGAPDLEEALAYYGAECVEQTRKQFQHAIDSGERCKLEQVVHLASGSTRYHVTEIVPLKDDAGRVFKLFGTVQDITERKLAEQELLKKTREIEDLYQNAPCGYHSLDSEGRIIQINDTELNWLGYTREEVVGKIALPDILAPESRAAFEGNFSLFKRGGVLNNLELDFLRKDGSTFPVLLTSTAVFDPGGNFLASRTMLSDNSARKQLERERSTHSARLADLSRHMVDVQENERRKLAGELHDRASPNLAALQLTLSNIARALPSNVLNEVEALLDDAQALLLDTTTGIRDICTDLRPATLDYAGLIPALHDYAQQFGHRTGIAVHMRTDSFNAQLPPNIQSLLFRIVQEALTNCAKHAQAGTIRVELTNSPARVEMTIIDDGIGFELQQLGESGNTPGLGLITMKERAEFAGGRFTIKSHPSSGTEITVTFDNYTVNAQWTATPLRRATDRAGLIGTGSR